MKKAFLFIAALAMSTMMWADVTVDSILLKGFAGSESTSYVSELLTGSSQNGITVAASNFNPSTSQIKGNQTSATGNFYIYNTDAYPAAITKIEIIAKIDANNYFKNNMYAATGTTSQAEVTDVAAGAAWNLETASWTFDEADGVTYFKLYSNEKFTNGSVKEAKVVVTYGGEPAPTKELVSLEIGGTAEKMAYFVGDKFDVTGLTVTGTYNDESTADVTSKVTWTITPETFAEASESASVAVKVNIGAIESEPFQVSGIVVTEKPAPVGVTYTKVTADQTDWAGEYVVVYEVEGTARVFTGVDATENYEEAEIIDNTVIGDFNTIILEATEGGYLVKMNGGDNDGKYISSAGNANELKFGETGATMVLSYDTESASTLITNEGGAALRYNKTSGQDRFRMYKNAGQQSVQLYKKESVGPTGIREAMVNANVRKAMVNGRLIIVKGEKAFDLQGRIVK